MLFKYSLQNYKLYVVLALMEWRSIKQWEIFEYGGFILLNINLNFLDLNASSYLRSFCVLGNMNKCLVLHVKVKS
jgi:hypothetical protein